MKVEEKDKLLRILMRSEVFLGLEDSQLEKIANLPSCRRQVCSKGDTIFQEGDLAIDFYVLDEGEVDLVMEIPTTPPQQTKYAIVHRMTKGSGFGWSALVAPHFRTLTALCAKPAKLLILDGRELTKLLDEEPRLGYEVMKGLVRVIGSRVWGTRHLVLVVSGKANSYFPG